MATRKSATARRREREVVADAPSDEAQRDELLLLSDAWAAFRNGLAAGAEEHFAAEPVGVPGPPPEAGGQVERLVVHNWKPEPGLVSIGDVQLELEPGQQVTLWVKAGAAVPADPAADPLDGSLSILTDDDRLVG
jgi:hypothetical protein